MKLDIDALRAAVQAVDPNARVFPWATLPNVIRVERSRRLGGMCIDLHTLPSARPDVEIRLCKTRDDRAVLRAVLDELDRQGFR